MLFPRLFVHVKCSKVVDQSTQRSSTSKRNLCNQNLLKLWRIFPINSSCWANRFNILMQVQKIIGGQKIETITNTPLGYDCRVWNADLLTPWTLNFTFEPNVLIQVIKSRNEIFRRNWNIFGKKNILVVKKINCMRNVETENWQVFMSSIINLNSYTHSCSEKFARNDSTISKTLLDMFGSIQIVTAGNGISANECCCFENFITIWFSMNFSVVLNINTTNMNDDRISENAQKVLQTNNEFDVFTKTCNAEYFSIFVGDLLPKYTKPWIVEISQ